jgi:uncharacterized protein YegJ (DUF2314 family)
VALVAAAIIGAPAHAKDGFNTNPNVSLYADDDVRMAGAIAEAQTWLPHFLDALRAAPPSARDDFSVKVGLDAAAGGREHIWVTDLAFEGDTLFGALANEPIDLPGLARGDRVTVELNRVSDWVLRTPQGAYGGFTVRVIRDDMNPARRAALSWLAEPPIPPEWRAQ